MDKILVTGCDGFIGKHVMKAFPDATGVDLKTGYCSGGVDGIIHLAGLSRKGEADKQPIECIEKNILLTADYLDFKPKWFIFASTCEGTDSIYGWSKRAAEDYIRLTHKKHIILRLSNVYGPGMDEDKLLPRLAAGTAGDVPDSVLPFEYIHVDDVVAQIKIAVRNFKRPHFKPYTLKLANGIAKTMQELRNVATSY